MKSKRLVVGLLGIDACSTSKWCQEARRLIGNRAEVWSPDDPAWDDINWNSGDECQSVVDAILDRQLKGIQRCTHLIVYLDGTDNAGLGARAEFIRLLWTPGLVLHVVCSSQLQGRHYMRAHYRYAKAKVTEYNNLEEAIHAIFV